MKNWIKLKLDNEFAQAVMKHKQQQKHYTLLEFMQAADKVLRDDKSRNTR